jgi:hypothetical protein
MIYKVIAFRTVMTLIVLGWVCIMHKGTGAVQKRIWRRRRRQRAAEHPSGLLVMGH